MLVTCDCTSWPLYTSSELKIVIHYIQLYISVEDLKYFEKDRSGVSNTVSGREEQDLLEILDLHRISVKTLVSVLIEPSEQLLSCLNHAWYEDNK